MTHRSIAFQRPLLVVGALLGTVGVGANAAEALAEPASLSRPQVTAELDRARQAGELAGPADFYRPVREALLDAQRVRRAQAATSAPQLAVAPVSRPASASR